MSGTTTESQKVAAHNRWHRDRNIVTSKCAICVAEHPEIGGGGDLSSESSTEPPVEILTEPPPTLLNPFDQQVESDRIWRFAALRRSIQEVATVIGCTVKELELRVAKSFNTTWETLSERAYLENALEIEANIYARAKGNDARFVLLFAKLKEVKGFFDPGFSVPKSVTQDLRDLSTEQLILMRHDLSKVVDREPRFSGTGKLSPTLELRACLPEDRPDKVEWTHVEPGSDAAMELPGTIINAGADLQVEEVVEKVPEPIEHAPAVPGPVVYSPQAGMLRL